uniref:Uncharacterized protein n=1 Tax=viral metagenome TaxID=1070528 RepID=A0A6C0AT41_9ZZZZ
MSQSNAAAIRRRVNQPPLPTSNVNNASTQNQTIQSSNAAGLTLPQVIAVIDKRLTNLETFMKETKTTGTALDGPRVTFQTDSSSSSSVPSTAFNDMVSEFNNRFEILAIELATLKDTIIKLQTYTMDVNKILMEERVHVFSDLGNGSNTSSTTVNEDATELTQSDINSVDLKDLANNELSFN